MAEIRTAVLYLRSPTDDEAKIEAQRRACLEHARLRGWQIVESFIDMAVSGTSDDRPGLQDLRRCVWEGRTEIVLVEDANRIARDFDLLEAFVGFCEDHQVIVACAEGPTALTTSRRRDAKPDVDWLERLRRMEGLT